MAELDDAQRRFLTELAVAAVERTEGRDVPPTSGDAWQGAIFDVSRAAELPAGRAFDAIYRAFLGRSNGPRAGWLLAGLDPSFVVTRFARGGAPARHARRRCRMSVGLQRLRDEPEAIRQGAIDKGEDPALVDRALELDTRRRELLGETEALKAERNQASKQVGEAIKGGAAPDGPEVAELKAASVAAGERIAALDAELAEVEAQLDDQLLRIPNPADPDVPGRW